MRAPLVTEQLNSGDAEQSDNKAKLFMGFPLGVTTKKGTLQKSQRGYISPVCREFPTQPNLTKTGV